MSNSLAESLSPYLLQHKDNPVNWVPWSEEAFETARQRDVPVFLSVGYAACHWCHVMAHESFENEEIGSYLNEHFVCIKVDREERPDIDQIYMNAVQLMTGHGGWPMSVFMDHDQKPFYAGTYWPLTPRGGMPGFAQVLDALVDAWTNRRTEIGEHAGEIRQALEQLAVGTGETASDVPGSERVEVAVEALLNSVDPTWGGFGAAPKFPHATDLDLLLRFAARTGDTRVVQAVELTLDKMAAGGIWDHIGGGFARYSVDHRWLVPHFEKMLYDNGLLAEVYTRAFQVTGNRRHAEVAAEILTYIQRDLVDPSGGFHCSEDADSEGVEGKFYVWRPNEIVEVLGEERGQRFCDIYDITKTGNFEGHSIPNLPKPISERAEELAIPVEQLHGELILDRENLRLAREHRIKPGRDNKIVTAWNALAIRAFAVAGVVLNRDDFVETATRAAEFILGSMRSPHGHLLHVYRSGTAHLAAYVDDHAILADAFISLYEATGNCHWLREAETLAENLLERFEDHEAGGFFYTASDSESLITRNKDWHDGSLVSGNGAAAAVLLRLSRLAGNERFGEAAAHVLMCGETVIRKQSQACGALIAALDEFHHGQGELVIAVRDRSQITQLRHTVMRRFRPGLTLAWSIADAPEPIPSPLAEAIPANKGMLGKQCTVYRCHDYRCETPLNDPSIEDWDSI